MKTITNTLAYFVLRGTDASIKEYTFCSRPNLPYMDQWQPIDNNFRFLETWGRIHTKRTREVKVKKNQRTIQKDPKNKRQTSLSLSLFLCVNGLKASISHQIICRNFQELDHSTASLLLCAIGSNNSPFNACMKASDWYDRIPWLIFFWFFPGGRGTQSGQRAYPRQTYTRQAVAGGRGTQLGL